MDEKKAIKIYVITLDKAFAKWFLKILVIMMAVLLAMYPN